MIFEGDEGRRPVGGSTRGENPTDLETISGKGAVVSSRSLGEESIPAESLRECGRALTVVLTIRDRGRSVGFPARRVRARRGGTARRPWLRAAAALARSGSVGAK